MNMKDGDYVETTRLFKVDQFEDELIKNTLNEVMEALDERGYNPINQIVGYIMSGDPGYISSHREARSKITNIDRTKIIEVLVKSYMKK